MSATSIGGPESVIGHTSTPAIGATTLSVNRTVGKPAWCTCCAMAARGRLARDPHEPGDADPQFSDEGG